MNIRTVNFIIGKYCNYFIFSDDGYLDNLLLTCFELLACVSLNVIYVYINVKKVSINIYKYYKLNKTSLLINGLIKL